MIDPIQKLSEIFPDLQNGQKAVVRDVKVSILQMQDTIRDLESTLARQPLPEAPASATMRIEYKGYDILFTLRDGTGSELLKKLEGAIVHFDKLGIKPGTQNGQSTSSAAIGNAPNCPTHNRPMKAGQKGGWYCPAKIADDDGTGKPAYCKQKA